MEFGTIMDRPGYATALALGVTYRQVETDWFERLSLETPISGDDLARIKAVTRGKVFNA